MGKRLKLRSLQRTLDDPEIQTWLSGNKRQIELPIAVYAQKKPYRKKKS